MSTAHKPALTLDFASGPVSKKPSKGVTLTLGQTEPAPTEIEPANSPKTARESAKAAAIASVNAAAEAAAREAAKPKPAPTDEIEPKIADDLLGPVDYDLEPVANSAPAMA